MNSKLAHSVFLSFILFTTANAAETPVPTQTKEKAVENLDARIQSLQQTRDCIDAAQSQEAIHRCRKNLKGTTENLKDAKQAEKDLKKK